MKLVTEEIKFKDGSTITVSQENWDISMALQENQRKAMESPLPDKRLQYFREKIYPFLVSCSSGGVPTMEGAYSLLISAGEDMDQWYKMVQKINPTWFTYLEHNEPETVEFSDGSKVIVQDGNVLSAIMNIRDLEEHAHDTPAADLHKQIFRSTFYPKLAACSSGDVPSEEEARNMPTVETNKWYEAVNRVNPHWFEAMHELKNEVEKQAELKKNSLTPTK